MNAVKRSWALKSPLAISLAFCRRPDHLVARGQAVVCADVVVESEADLLEVVGALDAPGRFSRRLDGRQEQRDQHGDDGDDDEELDQSERIS